MSLNEVMAVEIIPNVRKRIFFTITALIMGLLLLFVFQATNNYTTQKGVLAGIEERRLKINQITRAVKLSEDMNNRGRTDQKSISELEQAAAFLLPIMHTSEGKMLVQDLLLAIESVKKGGDLDQLVSVCRKLSAFQQKRLGEDLWLLETEIMGRGFNHLVISIIITIILGFAVAWGLHRLAREYLLTRVVLQGTTNGIIVGNEKGRVAILNDTLCKLLGVCKKRGMVGVPLAEVGEPGRILAMAIQENNFMQGREICFLGPDSKEICFLIDTIPWQDENGKLLGGMAVVRDYTKQWAEKQRATAENIELKEKAERDSMTGLYNYRAFIEHMQQLVRRKNQRRFSLLMIDLDNFKVFNDTLGHLAGDCLLGDLANIMVNAVRDDDMVARYGGDEFVIILQGANLNRAIDVGERLRLNIANYPFAGQECLPGGRVTVSMGISVYPENGSNVKELIRCADAALYQAKRVSRNRLEYYQPETSDPKEAVGVLNN
ncbi:sensor domain-containing diguanylate cyclase [Desulfotomaculum sp. 1211_IL3151]|uniref:sensor domain-containing diguanylate cyclase n=1 Tax=Desulfotomaculum sp. 1211_IL3151 TaxID=3084055 RepID=UPI002FD98A65